ncbi:MAG: GNAT family N-acetyltransferase [Planctomycetes bacterium]|nr:GNAT family N-acetyltransferase [Planctomycetota bacterium]
MDNAFRIGERIYFRPIELEDAPRLARWINDPEVHRGLTAIFPKNQPREREWIEGLGKRPDEVVFLIVLKEGDVPIGSCGLHQIHPANRKALFGILIGEKAYWNQGYGTEAVRLISEYGFNTLNLHRLELTVYENNPRAVRAYEKAGFKLEGRRREGRFWEGRFWDVLEMGLLDREFRELEEARRAPAERAGKEAEGAAPGKAPAPRPAAERCKEVCQT